MYYKAWQRHLAKPLSKQELAKVKESVSIEIKKQEALAL